MNEQLTLVNIMRSRLAEMQGRNPGYSVRAYAKKLGMGASTLSMVLNGQRRCSEKLTLQIADRLMLDPIERASVTEKFKSRREPMKNVVHYLKVSADQYVAFSEWHYMAILNLVRLKNFKNDPKWIASRIGITPTQAVEARERLIRLGMLTVGANGKLSRSEGAFRTSDDIANVSVRKGHFQHLEKAQKSLENDSIDERDFTWITLTANTARLKEMKQFIRKFENEFAQNFGDANDADEVFRLGVQMFPLSKPLTQTSKRKSV